MDSCSCVICWMWSALSRTRRHSAGHLRCRSGRDLEIVRTFSIGYLQLPGLSVSYYGQQRVTDNNVGKAVYGGSDLKLIQGDPDALAAAPWSEEAQRVLRQARQYYAAECQLFDGMLASRRNYDVAVGTGHDG